MHSLTARLAALSNLVGAAVIALGVGGLAFLKVEVTSFHVPAATVIALVFSAVRMASVVHAANRQTTRQLAQVLFIRIVEFTIAAVLLSTASLQLHVSWVYAIGSAGLAAVYGVGLWIAERSPDEARPRQNE